MNISALKEFMVVKSDGSVDYDKSYEKLGAELMEYEMRQETVNGFAANYINAVFDKNPGVRLATDFVINQAFHATTKGAAEFGVITDAFRRFIKANTGKQGSALFGTQKGYGGGIWRWSDVPTAKTAETPATETESSVETA